eukprot:929915-Pyramimonas_sp.AAC.1
MAWSSGGSAAPCPAGPSTGSQVGSSSASFGSLARCRETPALPLPTSPQPLAQVAATRARQLCPPAL